MAGMNKSLVGEKRRPIDDEVYIEIDGEIWDPTSKKKQRIPEPFEVGPLNWDLLEIEDDGYWSSREEMEEDLDLLSVDQSDGVQLERMNNGLYNLPQLGGHYT
ncbi:hypothetical protein LIER_17316 [Lithospermum erythrorhizon]|uniref:Uncharacterized protein n=1 Tax=Lithospermum erythrorhizon TaxID=34254 RepID=A0AAV3QBI3_LITER